MGSDDEAERLEAEAIAVADAQRARTRFGPLYERNFDAVYAYVARRARDRSDAEDITATVFQTALANIERFEWRGVPFRAWLTRIAANQIADQAARPTLAALPSD